MATKRHRRWPAVLVVLLLSTLVFNSGLLAQSSDETAIRKLVESYFAAYAREDLDAITQKWSDKAPDLVRAKARLREVFLVNEAIETTNLRLRRFAIEGDRANTLATFEFTAIDVRTKQPALARGMRSRSMSFVREAGEWKVWSDVSAEDGLAARLVTAQNESARDALLAEDKELLTPALAGSLYQMGLALGPNLSSQEALHIFVVMQSVAEKIGNKPLLAAALNGVASAMKGRGRIEEAVELFERSVKLREEAGLKHLLYVPLGNVGLLYMRMGNYSKAIESFQRVLTIAEEMGDKREQVKQTIRIAEVNIAQSNLDLALEYAKRGLAVSEQSGDEMGISLARTSLSKIYALTGNFDAAIEIQKSFVKSQERRGHGVGIAIYLNEIGDTYFLQGNYALAREYHEKAFSRIDEIGDKYIQIELLFKTGADYFHLGDYEKTVQYCSRAVSMARQIGYLPYLSDSLTWLGKAHYALDRTDEARRAFDEAITAIETLRTRVAGDEQELQRFFEKRVSPYYAMVELLAANNKHSEALAYAERAKGRVLLDVMRGRKASIAKSMNAVEREQETHFDESIAALNTQIQGENARPKANPTRLAELNTSLEQARLDQRAFQAKLYTTHPELRVKRGETQPLNLEEAGELLADSRTALLEYAVAGDKTFLFVLTSSPQKGLQQPVLRSYDLKMKRQDLVKRVQQLNQRIANNDLEYAQLSSELYNLLVAPARQQLQGKTRLVIVPDDILWETPFQALRSADGRFLIQQAAISYAPSLTVLREIRKSRKPKSSITLLAMGNPKLANQTVSRSKSVLMSASFEPLPEAERMVKGLAQMYGAKDSKVYLGAEAREEVLKAESRDCRILQLATHGVINNASPMYSHVVLAQSDDAKEDGLLEAWEIMQMDLNAELAVLSACETARGRVGAGEGVIGLAWALFVAGCPTTVVSQWKVESSSTTELMLEFHRQLLAGASKSEAMRSAALKVMADRRFGHPFYWAGFIVVGNGN